MNNEMAENTENKDAPPVQPATPAKPVHPGTANLIPAKPGEIRNPAGKPKGTLNRKTLFLRALDMAAAEKALEEQRRTLGSDHAPETIAEQLVARLVIDGLAGDKTAISMLLDGALDKVTEKTEVTGSFSALLARAQTPAGELPKVSKGDECKESLPPTKPAS